MSDIFSSKSFMKRYGQAPPSTGPLKSGGPAKPKEKRRVKIESEGNAGQGSTAYVRGNRSEDEGGRSVTIEKDYAGVDQKVVRRKKKDGTVKTKTIKISEKRAERIKKRKDKSHGPAKKTKSEKRLAETKVKIQDAKDATRNKKASESKEVIKQSNKAKRLEKRQKRQEGRAERKKIRKEEGKTVVRAKSDGTPGMESISKREAIKRSRKKQRE